MPRMLALLAGDADELLKSQELQGIVCDPGMPSLDTWVMKSALGFKPIATNVVRQRPAPISLKYLGLR